MAHTNELSKAFQLVTMVPYVGIRRRAKPYTAMAETMWPRPKVRVASPTALTKRIFWSASAAHARKGPSITCSKTVKLFLETRRHPSLNLWWTQTPLQDLRGRLLIKSKVLQRLRRGWKTRSLVAWIQLPRNTFRRFMSCFLTAMRYTPAEEVPMIMLTSHWCLCPFPIALSWKELGRCRWSRL